MFRTGGVNNWEAGNGIISGNRGANNKNFTVSCWNLLFLLHIYEDSENNLPTHDHLLLHGSKQSSAATTCIQRNTGYVIVEVLRASRKSRMPLIPRVRPKYR